MSGCNDAYSGLEVHIVQCTYCMPYKNTVAKNFVLNLLKPQPNSRNIKNSMRNILISQIQVFDWFGRFNVGCQKIFQNYCDEVGQQKI